LRCNRCSEFMPARFSAALLTHCPTQNRCALLLEMFFVCRIVRRKTATRFCWKCFLSDALSCAKLLRDFAGNACYLTHCPTEMLRAFPGNALVIHADQIEAVSGRDRAA